MTTMMVDESAVRLDAVSKIFGNGLNGTQALASVDLSVREGEFVCFLGRSGCGKSTLLSIIAGLDVPTEGRVDVGGRRVAMMFQDANLFPWLTVAENIKLALRLSGIPKDDWDRRTGELLNIVRLRGLEKMRPHELSGGMRQRVALARSLAQECDVLLMDEPFAALDAITRDALHNELERIWLERSLTILFVTHNVREAVRLGDRVVLMHPAPGRISREMEVELSRPRRMDDAEVAVRAAVLHAELDDQIIGGEN
ncbi:ABC transporter ATP-binding protein [Leifsonia sp. Root112D2]|uniref:ABC transporter ATP-binding protein n=1 Tax=Leifsonia sp. Root112D2 TaxID=1736426 RepID=UPI0006FD6AAA|nr:ABC transporter ATP-binding protein [Leifsonia sp. Root112D2]KQV07011.1 sulfate ABC transporter ATP-binding protein [Leifsonia sp. Root112D2]